MVPAVGAALIVIAQILITLMVGPWRRTPTRKEEKTAFQRKNAVLLV